LHHYAHVFDPITTIQAAEAASLEGHFRAVKLIRDKYSCLFNPTDIIAMLKPVVEDGHAEVSQYLLKLLPEETQKSILSELYVLVAVDSYVKVLRLLRDNILSLEDKARPLNQACNVAAQNGHANVVKHLLKDSAEIRESVA